jgi:polyhydroxyalkanoate synthesis regulator phasin
MTTEEAKAQLESMIERAKIASKKASEVVEGLTKLGEQVEKLVSETESPRLKKVVK